MPGSRRDAVHGADRPSGMRVAVRSRPTSQAGQRGILIRVDSGTVKALERTALDRVATIQALGVDTRQSLLDRARG